MNSTGAEPIGRDQRDLNAYHDGELSGLRRWVFERRLARSAGLRAELEGLKRLSRCVQELDPQPPSVDVWDEIAIHLPAIDAQFEGQRQGLDGKRQGFDGQRQGFDGQRQGFDGQRQGLEGQRQGFDGQRDRRDQLQQRGAEQWEWRRMDWLAAYSRPLVAVAAGVALALALFLGIMEDGPPPTPGIIRWLDTGGRSVIVLEDRDDATIVWLLDALEDGALEGGSREAV